LKLFPLLDSKPNLFTLTTRHPDGTLTNQPDYDPGIAAQISVSQDREEG
jgi:hypothetical protein